MHRRYPEAIFSAAKELRKKSTEAERILWNEIKSKKLNNIKFRFQVPYDWFILDFLCPEYKLIIELDGNYHINCKERDFERDLYFEEKGYTILRFKNKEVFDNIEKVKKRILIEIDKIKKEKKLTLAIPLSRGT
ncbi:MAG: DUF559 domain-containing protein [Candidatus Cloacimonetes bacterium]|nr:DUF559 domain-containing protein [Candidatus Cloacimonadota bacterium]